MQQIYAAIAEPFGRNVIDENLWRNKGGESNSRGIQYSRGPQIDATLSNSHGEQRWSRRRQMREMSNSRENPVSPRPEHAFVSRIVRVHRRCSCRPLSADSHPLFNGTRVKFHLPRPFYIGRSPTVSQNRRISYCRARRPCLPAYYATERLRDVV